MTAKDSKFKYDVWPGSTVLRTFTLEEQIDWFESILQKQVFEPAQILLEAKNEDFDLAVLTILNAVPEMLAKCQGYEEMYNEEWPSNKKPVSDEKPKPPTRKAYLYRKGIEYIFPNRPRNIVFTDKELFDKLIYGKLRSGLAHSIFADERIRLLRNRENLCSVVISEVEIQRKPEWIYRPPTPLLSINVPEWYKQTKNRVNDYLNELRDDSNKVLRKNFQKQIILGGEQQKDTAEDCVCPQKIFCFQCAAVKFPIKSLGESKSS